MDTPALTPTASWELTATISPRRIVRCADRDAQGRVINSYPLVHPIAGHVPATSWAVCLADSGRRFRLLCADLDAKSGPEPVHRDRRALTGLLDDLRLPHLVCGSGPSGGVHVWIGLADSLDAEVVAVLARLLAGWLPTLDPAPLLNPATGCVRPPGSPHRDGGVSRVLSGDLGTLTHPTVTSEEVDRLIGALAAHTTAAPLASRSTGTSTGSVATERRLAWDAAGHPFLPGARRELPPASRAALAEACGPGTDASAVLWRVLCGAATAHWRYADVAALASAPGLEHVRTLRQANQRLPRPATGAASTPAVLARQWRRAVRAMAAIPTDRAGADPTFDARAELVAGVVRAVQSRADATRGRWQGRRGIAHRKVLDTICLFELQAVRLDVEADIRRIGLTCGLDRETARRALLALADDGWLERTQPASGRRAARWTTAPAGVVHNEVKRTLSQADPRPASSGAAQRHLLLTTLSDRITAAAHDAFAPTGGLGRRASALYARLAVPATTQELGPLLGWTTDDIDHTLVLLVQEGLIERCGACWQRTDPHALELAADRLGTAGRGQRRAVRYAVERLAWAWWLSELDHLRSRQRLPGQRRARPQRSRTHPWSGGVKHPRRSNGRADFARAHVLCRRWLAAPSPSARGQLSHGSVVRPKCGRLEVD